MSICLFIIQIQVHNSSTFGTIFKITVIKIAEKAEPFFFQLQWDINVSFCASVETQALESQ